MALVKKRSKRVMAVPVEPEGVSARCAGGWEAAGKELGNAVLERDDTPNHSPSYFKKHRPASNILVSQNTVLDGYVFGAKTFTRA
jgi:hypothetical protein